MFAPVDQRTIGTRTETNNHGVLTMDADDTPNKAVWHARFRFPEPPETSRIKLAEKKLRKKGK